jgi:hypothetical protein
VFRTCAAGRPWWVSRTFTSNSKRTSGSRVSEKQTDWLSALGAQGYEVALCKGWEAAARVILNYLRMEAKSEAETDSFFNADGEGNSRREESHDAADHSAAACIRITVRGQPIYQTNVTKSCQRKKQTPFISTDTSLATSYGYGNLHG